ncbi:zinc ribbon domain-containing protein, partial [Ligilactobacillus murinus]
FVMGTNGTDKLTLDDRKWTCPNCGVHHIRDWNAAKNILDKGIAKLA